jgi:hypothetical protein
VQAQVQVQAQVAASMCVWLPLFLIAGLLAMFADWSKYDENVLATAGVDKTISLWDMRNPGAPLMQLVSHNYAVRRCPTAQPLATEYCGPRCTRLRIPLYAPDPHLNTIVDTIVCS